MFFNQCSIKEIDNYLAGLGGQELVQALHSLSKDKRKSAQVLIKKYHKMLTKKAVEKERLLKLWELEKVLYQKNFKYIVGIDEAGRGPLAGPVVASAVILPPYCLIEGLDDSKKINEKKRIQIAMEIKKKALAWSIGVVDSLTIDKLNILQATRYAMQLAFNSLNLIPQYALIDGEKNPLLKIPQSGVIQGDSKSASIAAASILAKVHRDNLMKIYDQLYPQYQFAANKGYGTKSHLQVIERIGPSLIHRFSFKPVKVGQNMI